MDLNMATIDGFPYIQDVLNSPLCQFINSLDDGCGYIGTNHDLIIIWAHPMFIKTKVVETKKDKHNWWEAMSR